MKGTTATKARRPATLGATLTPLLFSLISVPSGLFYLGLASSTALGSMAVSSWLVIASFVLLKVSRRETSHASLTLLFSVIAIVVHLFVASSLGPTSLIRGVASIIPFCICMAGGWAMAAVLARARSTDLTRTLKRCLALLGLITFLGFLGWLQPAGTGQYGKPVFPFSEPSHLALMLAPLLIFVCVISSPWQRPLYLGAAFIGTAALENLTMAAACVLAALICLKPRHLLLLTLLLIPAIITIDLSYYSERLVFNVESQNLSSLVYLQGWQMLIESLERSHGFGLGFQQLGVFGTNVSASDQINLLLGDSLNLFDGGFNLAKILSELGMFGVLLMLAYAKCLVCAIRLLRRTAHSGERHPAVLVLSASCIAGYLIELFLRGMGYFTPTGILLVFALLTWHRFYKQHKNIKIPLANSYAHQHAQIAECVYTNAGINNSGDMRI